MIRRRLTPLAIGASIVALSIGIQWRVRVADRERDAARVAALEAVADIRDAARREALEAVAKERDAARTGALESSRAARREARDARDAARRAVREAARNGRRADGPERFTIPFFSMLNVALFGGGLLMVGIAFLRGARQRRERELDAMIGQAQALRAGDAPHFDPLTTREGDRLSRR
ncbi:MAG: hypothetical protein MUF00_05680 [Gemmatimonadaceae bacterium]|jgi:hypothetical protein|nr:hypothetical protein [Gemmatimonadaceae bacterium]